MDAERMPISEVFSENEKEVVVAGWVHNTRELGKIRFIILKDSTGMVQVIGFEGKTDDEIFEKMNNIARESVIRVKGSVKESERAPGGKEIAPSEIEILNPAAELPIDVSDFSKTELPKRLDYRFLDLHRQRVRDVFRIQSEIANSFRECFYGKGFTEVQLPSIIASSSEGGTELFSVNYFDQKVFLAQSPQLYKQMLACSPVERVYTVTPVWRAEKHNTVRHLNESRQMDVEVAFADQMQVMKLEEEAVKRMVQNVLKRCDSEMESLGLKGKLKVPEAKYLSYDEAVEILKMEYGEDFSPQDEKKLDGIFPDTLVFVHSWPADLKPFYIMPKGGKADAKLSEGFDAIYRGMEISSGGQRIHVPELLEKTIKSKGLDPKDFKSYVDSFRFGAPPHAGWSIGLERMTQLVVGEKNIREAVLFPRDRDRLVP